MSAEGHKELNDSFFFNVNETSLKTNCSENCPSLGFVCSKRSEKSSNKCQFCCLPLPIIENCLSHSSSICRDSWRLRCASSFLDHRMMQMGPDFLKHHQRLPQLIKAKAQDFVVTFKGSSDHNDLVACKAIVTSPFGVNTHGQFLSVSPL